MNGLIESVRKHKSQVRITLPPQLTHFTVRRDDQLRKQQCSSWQLPDHSSLFFPYSYTLIGQSVIHKIHYYCNSIKCWHNQVSKTHVQHPEKTSVVFPDQSHSLNYTDPGRVFWHITSHLQSAIDFVFQSCEGTRERMVSLQHFLSCFINP